MSILTSILRRDRRNGAAATGTEHNPQDEARPSSPPLIVLLPDAAGIASYRYFSFPSSQAAERFVEWDLRGKITLDTVCFWAMPCRPATAAEPTVLIRGPKAGSVHAFAFTDMTRAAAFVRDEMRTGLTPDRVMIFWAGPARIELDQAGQAFVTPAQPPEVAGQSAIAVGPFIHKPIAHVDSRRSVTATRGKKRAQVIDFPSAAKRLRAPGETAKWWTNMIEAMDEALDAYVAKQVRGRMAWRRLSREIASAARAEQRLPMAPVVPEHVPAAPCDEELPSGADTGDDSWFIPRREWGARPDEPFRGFGSPPGRF